MPKGVPKILSKKDEQKIKDEYLIKPIKRIADELGTTYGTIMRRLDKWGLEIPEEVIRRNRNNSQFKRGQDAYNKGLKQSEFMSKEAIIKCRETQFKKGNKPHNTQPVGHERTSKDGYIVVKVEDNLFRHKHVIEWEKFNGKIPEGYCVSFINGRDINIDNLELITREENMLRNSKHKFHQDIIPSMAVNSKLKKTIIRLTNEK